MRERFAALYTAALADVLDDRGLRRQTLPPELRPVAPGMRLAGEAFTVAGEPGEQEDWDAAIRTTLAMLGSVPSGHVAVYATGHDRSAHFGELSAVSLATRGVAGCVIDGGCRDTRFIADEGFPVFARFVTPEDSTWRWRVTATQEPIEIGGVRIEPGRLGRRGRGRRRRRPARRRPRGPRRGRAQGRDRERDPGRSPRRHAAARGVRALRHVLRPLSRAARAAARERCRPPPSRSPCAATP